MAPKKAGHRDYIVALAADYVRRYRPNLSPKDSDELLDLLFTFGMRVRSHFARVERRKLKDQQASETVLKMFGLPPNNDTEKE